MKAVEEKRLDAIEAAKKRKEHRRPNLELMSCNVVKDKVFCFALEGQKTKITSSFAKKCTFYLF